MPELIVKKADQISLILILMFFSSDSYAKTHNIDPKYGKGQTRSFMNAMYERSPDISETELQEIAKSIPPRITERFFIRLGANWGRSILSQVKNTSVHLKIKDAKVATSNYTSPSKLGAELAFGYRLDRLSVELEAIAVEYFKFNVNPLFNNQPGKLDSIVKAQGGFLNVYYDILDFMPVRAFLGVGLGTGINSTNSNFSNAPPISTGVNFTSRNIAGAYNLVAGAKINIASRVFINGAVRYTNFAGFGNIKAVSSKNVEWLDENRNWYLQGQHAFFGFSLSITHIFL